MRQVSMLMASSRVITLVVTLLMVIVLGLYVVRLHRLTDVMILASAVLLARLDLIRIGIVPPPLLTIIGFTAVLLSGIGLGWALPNPEFFYMKRLGILWKRILTARGHPHTVAGWEKKWPQNFAPFMMRERWIMIGALSILMMKEASPEKMY